MGIFVIPPFLVAVLGFGPSPSRAGAGEEKLSIPSWGWFWGFNPFFLAPFISLSSSSIHLGSAGASPHAPSQGLREFWGEFLHFQPHLTPWADDFLGCKPKEEPGNAGMGFSSFIEGWFWIQGILQGSWWPGVRGRAGEAGRTKRGREGATGLLPWGCSQEFPGAGADPWDIKGAGRVSWGFGDSRTSHGPKGVPQRGPGCSSRAGGGGGAWQTLLGGFNLH